MRELGHRPSLDAIRGASWAGVFGAHAGLFPIRGIGQSAMFVFFVLSGFLITELLIEEHRRTDGVSLRHFFRRRALRLLPALGIFLLAWLAVVVVFGSQPWMTTVPGGGKGAGEPFGVALEGVGVAAAYLTNWLTIFHGFSGYVPLGHLWSLAVEEQLYVVWAPLLAIVLFRMPRRSAPWIVLGLAVASVVEVAFVSNASNRVFMGTDTRSGAFLLGGALAFAWSRGAWQWLSERRSALFVCVAAVALLWSAPRLAHPSSRGADLLAWSLSTAASGLLVVSAVESSAQLLSHAAGRAITYLGRRSYALYLWHYVWLTWLRDLGLAGVGLALLASLGCAELSWHLVEKRALRLRDRGRRPLAADGTSVGRALRGRTPGSVELEPVGSPQAAAG